MASSRFRLTVFLFLFFFWTENVTQGLTLEAGSLSVSLDPELPRPLFYSHAMTGDTFRASLTGWDFHYELRFNSGQVVCGESGLITSYDQVTSESVNFILDGTCLVNWADNETTTTTKTNPSIKKTKGQLPFLVLQLAGSISVSEDPSLPGSGAAFMSWVLSSAEILGGETELVAQLYSVDFIGSEFISFQPKQPVTPACFYVVDDNGDAPKCGGDTYFVDANQWTAIDEWYSPTWSDSIVTGQVDINTLPQDNVGCLYGAQSRLSAGPLASIIAGGWSISGKTGIMAISNQNHLPFWTGLRSYDVPGRCSVFTVAASTINLQYPCGSGLPFSISVGLFPDLTQDDTITSDDLYLWRRMQYPRADSLYLTTQPYKIFLDGTAYTSQHNQTRIPFSSVVDYIANQSLIFDGYPQTTILVGWQGLGHDTLYPALDVVNLNLGGQEGLFNLGEYVDRYGPPGSSLSYHVNADEAYSHFNGTENPEFDIGICRLNVDHLSAWYSNCTVTEEQIPDCGIRCSISKTRDSVSFARYSRYSRMFDVIPSGLRTIHSDAWRNVGASWEEDDYLSMEDEQRCGQEADSSFWRSHGASLGVEGENGQAANFLGQISYWYHANGWDPSIWGRIVCGSSLGFDDDVDCPNGGFCGWDSFADSFYLESKIYQLALTDELLSVDLAQGKHRFMNGGVVNGRHRKQEKRHHVTQGTYTSYSLDVTLSPPSFWPFGGDSIPISNGLGGVLVPTVMLNGSLDPYTLHAYQTIFWGNECPLYDPGNNGSYLAANNTCFSTAASPYSQYNINPELPEIDAVYRCNTSCWSDTRCLGWDLIKVTPTSGKTEPLCMLYDVPTLGCSQDPNQWAGTKAPLQWLNHTQIWTIPLSWVGLNLTATTISPEGYLPGPEVTLIGRVLRLEGMTEKWPVRLSVSP